MPASKPILPTTRALAAWVTAAATLAGCASLPAPVLPDALPAAFGHAPASDAAAVDLQRWWQALGDPLLDELVGRALQQNLGVAQARSRLRQARLLAGGGRGQFQPVLAASARSVQDAAAVDSYFNVGLDASWELGLFGLRESNARLHQGLIEDAAASLHGVRVALVAEVAHQTLALRAAQQEAAVLIQLQALDNSALALQRERQRLKLATPDAELAIDARLALGRIAAASARQSAAAAAQALATLLGLTTPEPTWLTAQAPTSAPDAAKLTLSVRAVPTDLLRWRPDVQAAAAAVDKAAGEAGEARAELYPRIVLGASFVTSFNLTKNRRTLLSSVPVVGPMIDVPLFDWGRRRMQADARDEALAASLLGYRQAVMDAVGETETALGALAQAQERAGELAAMQARAQTQAERLRQRQRLGLASGPERLDSERAVLLAVQAHAAAQAAALQGLVTLCKALGGAPLDPAVLTADINAAP